MPRIPVVVVLAIASVSPDPRSQGPLFCLVSAPASGGVATGVGDVDGDGVPDLAVGNPNYYPGGGASVVEVYAGATGGLIRTIYGGYLERFGTSIGGAGDVNGDGRPDIVIGAPYATFGGNPEAGRAVVVSGATGLVLFELGGSTAFDHFGADADGIGDWNGDGRPDVAVGAPDFDGSGNNMGHVRIHSGLDGSVLAAFTGSASGDRFGFAVFSAGDINMDGRGDLIVGAPYADAPGAADAGKAYVFTAGSPAPVHVLSGSFAGGHFGWSVGNGGRMDADPAADVVVGAPDESITYLYEGRVRVFSGATGGLLFTSSGANGDSQRGISLAGIGDYDGDGRGDVVISAPAWANPGGVVDVISGTNGGILFQLPFSFSTVSAVGDLDGNGRPEFLVSGPLTAVFNRDPAVAPRHTMLHLPGDAAYHAFGSAVGSGRDLDADGVPDLVTGSPYLYTSGYWSGRVRAWSGAGGQTLRTLDGPNPNDNFGASVDLLGDVNGDGRGEILVGAPQNGNWAQFPGWGYVRVISGADGTTLRHLTYFAQQASFGRSVARLGDLDQDGIDDFGVGAPHHTVPGITIGLIRIFSGATGAVLRDITGAAGPTVGYDVAPAGDVDGDGVPDVLSLGSAWSVRSGATGALLPLTFADSRVAGIGDVNADGRADFVTATPEGLLSAYPAGVVRVISGATGATLFTKLPQSLLAEQIGFRIAAPGDVDGDGVPDFSAAGRRTSPVCGVPSFLRTWSGATGAVISTIDGPETSSFFGAMARIGDLNGDGRSDLAVGWPQDPVQGGAGSVRALSLVPLPEAAVTSVGTGCGAPAGFAQASLAATVPAFSPLPAIVPNALFAIAGGPPLAAGSIYASAWPAAPLTVSGCTVWIDPATAFEFIPFTTTAQGAATLTAGLPVAPRLAGTAVALQSLILPSPGGFRLTNAVRVVLGY